MGLAPEQVVLVGLGWRQLSVPSVVTVILVTLVPVVTWLLLPWEPYILPPVLLGRWRSPVLTPMSRIRVHIHRLSCIHAVVSKILSLMTGGFVGLVLPSMGLLLSLVDNCWGSHSFLSESVCHLLHERLSVVYGNPVPIV